MRCIAWLSLRFPSRVEPMPFPWPTGCFDWRSAVVGREPCCGREPSGVTEVGEDQTGDDRSDTVQLDQRGGGRLHRVADAGLDGGEVAIETAHIAEQIRRELSALESDQSLRMDAPQQLRCPITRHTQGVAAGDE